jgi:hypothetical protein
MPGAYDLRCQAGEPLTHVAHDHERDAMHKSLRERLEELFTHDAEPSFEASDEPTLVAFAQIFADSNLCAFDANKHLRTDALSPIYDCETESRRQPGAKPELFSVTWAPVWDRDDPVTGFRTGPDSTFIGSTPTVAVPQDERTAALLLLVTSTFVHLSGTLETGRCVVRGADEDDHGNYRFLEYSPEATAASEYEIQTASGESD